MKQLFSPLTMAMLTVMVLLLIVNREGKTRRSQSREEIRSRQPVEKESPLFSLETYQDSLYRDMTLITMPLKDGMPAGKGMNILIY